MEPEGSLPHLQEPAICSYPQPDRSSPCPFHSTSLRYILILSCHLRLGLPSGIFPLGINTLDTVNYVRYVVRLIKKGREFPSENSVVLCFAGRQAGTL